MVNGYRDVYELSDTLPTYEEVYLIPLSITDKTDDLYYHKVNDLIMFPMCVDCFH